jgi:hypothetical protein
MVARIREEFHAANEFAGALPAFNIGVVFGCGLETGAERGILRSTFSGPDATQGQIASPLALIGIEFMPPFGQP